MRFLEAYSVAWREVQEFRPQMVGLEFNPLAVHIAPPSETMVIVTFRASIALSHGTIELCLPFRHLKPIVPKVSFDEYLISRQTQSGPAVQPLFAKSIEAAKVPVSVELGRAEVMFQDLLGLEVGDTIRLSSAIGEPLRIRVNERCKFLGHPGTTRDGKMAAKLIRVLNEGDDEFEE
jgi:flagellar motor switch protein FliM